MRLRLLTFTLALVLGWPTAGRAQSSVDTAAWNDARTLSLIAFARERRQQPLADSALRNYQARAEGLVYFYLDRRDVEERILVRTDQVALDVFWAQPDRTKQKIIGLRNESSLPNRMYYHLDHLTVVQNGFGDVMRMGDGDEVRDVPHPAAPGSEQIYDFRLADSVTLRLPGAPEPIKAYEIRVRPKRDDRPAFVGSIYVDHAGGDIVRMTFTFTPVSYVDRRLDYINISLDNSLWEGRYWLPFEQAVEIRRQVPELDFVVSSVIQARFRVQGYEFNQDLPESLFWGYPVVTVSRQEREAYEFDRGIYEDLHNAGLAPPPAMKEIRARAAELIRQRTLSGLPRLRLSLPNASSALRFNRGESLYLGWGGSFTPAEALRFEVLGGFSFGRERPVLSFGVKRELNPDSRFDARAWAGELRDIGVRPGIAMALNTITSLWGDDFTDPYFASGVELGYERAMGTEWRFGGALRAERHESARLETEPVFGDSPFRPVRPATEGTLLGGRIELERRLRETASLSWAGRVQLDAGTFDSNGFAIPTAELQLFRGTEDRRGSIDVTLTGGIALGDPAPQQHFLLGGRNTLPGFPYRMFGGDAFVLTNVVVSRDIAYPFVRARLLGAAGWTDQRDDTGLPPGFAFETGNVRASLGAGVGLLYDLVRLDLARGFGRDGEWQLLLSLQPKVWPWL